jgi:hypothetical protein
MRNLSPKRRRAAIVCGVCAAIIPSTTLMMEHFHASKYADFGGGLLVGLALTLSVATFIKSRQACS